MATAELVPSARAAEILGVSQQEVRRLMRTGVLRGVLVANRAMVDRTSLEHRAQRPAAPGRTLTPTNAWALLRLVSGADAGFVTPVVRSRLKASLRDVTPDRVRQVTARRAVVRHYRLPERYLAAASAERGLVRTGLSALDADGGFDLVTFGTAVLDAYCTAATRDRLVRTFGLVVGDELSEVTLREVEDLDLVRAAGDGTAAAVTAAVCLDLMDNLDPRVLAAGRKRLQELVDDVRGRAAR